MGARTRPRTTPSIVSHHPSRNRCASLKYNGDVRRTIFVGCCGFPQARGRYFGDFPVVELQSTFYQPPGPELCRRWREQAPSDFIFCLKAWQLVTHPATSSTYRRLKRPVPQEEADRYGFFRPSPQVTEAWNTTLAVARALCAPVAVLQCPPSFTPSDEHVANLESFARRSPRDGLTLAWEPRGRWPPALVRELCARLELVHCVDPFTVPSQFGRIAYFRLHGIGGYRYRYTDQDLGSLLEQCQAELAAGREAVYVLFNNISMLEDARRFRRLLEA